MRAALIVLVLSRLLVAQSTAVTVETLVRMVKLKMPDAVVVRAAREGALPLPLSPADLIALREAGATDAVLVDLAASPGAAAAPGDALAGVRCEGQPEQRKRVIAVRAFDFGAVKTADQALLDTLSSIGKGMTALAVKRIQEAQRYRVVEREAIQAVIAEQDFGNTGRAAQGTQARLGKILGADAILLGTITVFGRDDRKNSVGGGGFGPSWLAGLKFKWGEDKAVVAISYRLVDAETSESIAVGEARGESSRKSKGLDLGAATGSGGGAGGFDMTSSNFAETIIGEATINCMSQLMEDLNSKESQIRLRNMEVDTRVAEVSGTRVYLAAGSAAGVRACDRFEVSRILKEIHDPVTKELLDLQLNKVGELLVTEVRERIAIGVYAGGPVEIGYSARKIVPKPPNPPPGPLPAVTKAPVPAAAAPPLAPVSGTVSKGKWNKRP